MLTKELKKMAWQLELPRNLQPAGLREQYDNVDMETEDWSLFTSERNKARKTYQAMPWVVAGLAVALTAVVIATTKSKAKKDGLALEESLRKEFMDREATLATNELGLESEEEFSGQVRWYAKYQNSDNPKISATAETIRDAFIDSADQEYDEAVDILFEIGSQARDSINEDLEAGDAVAVKWEIDRAMSIKASLESWYKLGGLGETEAIADSLGEEPAPAVEELKETA